MVGVSTQNEVAHGTQPIGPINHECRIYLLYYICSVLDGCEGPTFPSHSRDLNGFLLAIDYFTFLTGLGFFERDGNSLHHRQQAKNRAR